MISSRRSRATPTVSDDKPTGAERHCVQCGRANSGDRPTCRVCRLSALDSAMATMPTLATHPTGYGCEWCGQSHSERWHAGSRFGPAGRYGRCDRCEGAMQSMLGRPSVGDVFDTLLSAALWPVTRDRPRQGGPGLAAYLHSAPEMALEAALRPDFGPVGDQVVPPFAWLHGGDVDAIRAAAEQRPMGRRVYAIDWHVTPWEAELIRGALSRTAIVANRVRKWLQDNKTTADKLDDAGWRDLIRWGQYVNSRSRNGDVTGVGEQDLGRAVELVAYEDRYGKIPDFRTGSLTRGLQAIARSPWRRVPVAAILNNEPLVEQSIGSVQPEREANRVLRR